MSRANSETLQEYAAFCPSCGKPCRFDDVQREREDLETAQAHCTNVACARTWIMEFHLDESGTFGVVGRCAWHLANWECHNDDRIF